MSVLCTSVKRRKVEVIERVINARVKKTYELYVSSLSVLAPMTFKSCAFLFFVLFRRL